MPRCGVLGGGALSLAKHAALWFARQRCGQLGNACGAVLCSVAVQAARENKLMHHNMSTSNQPCGRPWMVMQKLVSVGISLETAPFLERDGLVAAPDKTMNNSFVGIPGWHPPHPFGVAGCLCISLGGQIAGSLVSGGTSLNGIRACKQPVLEGQMTTKTGIGRNIAGNRSSPPWVPSTASFPSGGLFAHL
eukprot:gene24495-biopygen11906